MQLFLIRHAQSENNARPPSQRVEDPALTGLGHEQARRLAQAASQWRLTRIITSPFMRAMQTAAHLQQATGVVTEVRIPLHEKGGCVAGTGNGSLQGRPGLTRQQIAAEFPNYQIAANIDGQGWWGSKAFETTEQAAERARRLFEDTKEEFDGSDERVAFVMHGDFLLLLLACFHQHPLNLAWNASFSSVQLHRGSATLSDYSSVRHLPNYIVTW